MEEVDKIILHNLTSLGWDCEGESKDLKSIEINDIAKGISKCLFSINEGYDIPHSLPHNMAQRFRAAASLVEAIKDLGYHGNIGYQTILYPSEHELRKIFMFLIEKLPKESSLLQKEPLCRRDYLFQRTREKVSSALKRPWVPPHCLSVVRKKRLSNSDDISLTEHGILHCISYSSSKKYLYGQQIKDKLKEKREFLRVLYTHIPSLSYYPSILSNNLQQFSSGDLHFQKSSRESSSMANFDSCEDKSSLPLLPMSQSVMRFLSADRRICNITARSSQEMLEMSHSTSSQENNQKIIEQKNEVQRAILQISSNLEQLNSILNDREELIYSNNAKLIEIKENCAKEELHLNNIKRASSFASDPLENIEILKTSLLSNEKKEEKVLAQWEQYKGDLENQLQQLNLVSSQNKSQKQEITGEIAQIRDRMKELGSEAVRKQTLLVKLKEQFESLPKGINRSVYTKRILDISSKVRKQKAEINKVINDIRTVQKEINSITGKLERTFAVAEDSSYKAASSNEKARPIYRIVVTIHEMCGELVDIVRDTGILQREVAEFKLQLDAEKNKNVEDILRQLEGDLARIKNENSILKEKISQAN